jgi:hypothetical protein
MVQSSCLSTKQVPGRSYETTEARWLRGTNKGGKKNDVIKNIHKYLFTGGD